MVEQLSHNTPVIMNKRFFLRGLMSVLAASGLPGASDAVSRDGSGNVPESAAGPAVLESGALAPTALAPATSSAAPASTGLILQLATELRTDPTGLDKLLGSPEVLDQFLAFMGKAQFYANKKQEDEMLKKQEEQKQKLASSIKQWMAEDPLALARTTKSPATILTFMSLSCPYCQILMDSLIEWSKKAPDVTIIPWFFAKARPLDPSMDPKERKYIEEQTAQDILLVKGLMLGLSRQKGAAVWEQIKIIKTDQEKQAMTSPGKPQPIVSQDQIVAKLAPTFGMTAQALKEALESPDLDQRLQTINGHFESLTITAMPTIAIFKKGAESTLADIMLRAGALPIDALEELIKPGGQSSSTPAQAGSPDQAKALDPQAAGQQAADQQVGGPSSPQATANQPVPPESQLGSAAPVGPESPTAGTPTNDSQKGGSPIGRSPAAPTSEKGESKAPLGPIPSRTPAAPQAAT